MTGHFVPIQTLKTKDEKEFMSTENCWEKYAKKKSHNSYILDNSTDEQRWIKNKMRLTVF